MHFYYCRLRKSSTDKHDQRNASKVDWALSSPWFITQRYYRT